MRYGKRLTSLMVLVLGLGAVGCETHTGNAALLGGAGGAALGAAIGSHSHARAGEGALLGGAIGAIGGAIVGNEMDRQARDPGYGYDRGGAYYEEGPVYERYETRVHRPSHHHHRTVRYYRVDDCPPPRYAYRHRHYSRGGRHYGHR